MEPYEILKKIIGDIHPVGDSNIDEYRSKNFKYHKDVTYHLVADLVAVAKHRNRHEHSVKNLGIMAHKELLELKELIDAEVERGE